MKPISKFCRDTHVISDNIGITYDCYYMCNICGYRPPDWGCFPEMQRHLKRMHNIKPPEGKYFWMSGYSDREIKEGLPHGGYEEEVTNEDG